MLNSPVLVLNRSYLPIHLTSVRRALTLVYTDTARVLDEHYETFDFAAWCGREAPASVERIGTTRGPLPAPRTIVLRGFDRLPRRHVRYSRANVFARDDFTCQYCGARPVRAQLNLDHVVPRAQAGRTCWENVVASCVRCNRRKGGRTPEQAGLRLRRPPARPRWTPSLALPDASDRFAEWQPFLAPFEGRGRNGKLARTEADRVS